MRVSGWNRKVKVAIAHVAPVLLNKRKTLLKVEEYAARAASAGAQLVVFGESFVPGFPIWNMLYAPIDQHGFFRELYDNAVDVDGGDADILCDVASQNGVIISIGVTEKSSLSSGTMWNTNLLIDEHGSTINRHRKIMATWAEKLSWAAGDGSGLRVCQTGVGPLGMLVCGENFNTLARFALLAQGELLHISTYPPVWPTERPRAEAKGYDLAEAIRIRAAAHSIEGKVFNVVASYFLDDAGKKMIARSDKQIMDVLRHTPQGVSMVVGPDGRYVCEPVSGHEDLLVAELDYSEIIKYRELHDITGHYNRFDIFSLKINMKPSTPVEFIGDVGNADVRNPALRTDPSSSQRHSEYVRKEEIDSPE